MKTPKPDKQRKGLVDWSYLRWHWSPIEILMLVGIVVTLGTVGLMFWGTFKEFQDRGTSITGGASSGPTGGDVGGGHATPSGQ